VVTFRYKYRVDGFTKGKLYGVGIATTEGEARIYKIRRKGWIGENTPLSEGFVLGIHPLRVRHNGCVVVIAVVVGEFGGIAGLGDGG
jgi:hypothetical protein